jgi:hypothetical protein
MLQFVLQTRLVFKPWSSCKHDNHYVRFQVLTAASMMLRVVFRDDDGGSTHL